MSKDYEAAAKWAEDEMEIDPDSATALHGADAAAHGRAALEAALGGPDEVERAITGRPPLEASAPAGERSRIRHVRLGPALDARLDAAATDTVTQASAIIRDALDRYLPNA